MDHSASHVKGESVTTKTIVSIAQPVAAGVETLWAKCDDWAECVTLRRAVLVGREMGFPSAGLF